MKLPIPRSIKPMLSKLQSELPRGEGWLYEPKWDGFRAIVFFDGSTTDIISRDGRPLLRYFPELPAVLESALRGPSVVDGEVVITGASGLDFGTLQQRIHPAESRVNLLARQTPAGFIAFDMLAEGQHDLRRRPFSERRAALLKAVDAKVGLPPKKRGSRVLLTPQTSDAEEAEKWFDTLEPLGVEGVIAKQVDLTYRSNERAMIKVKHLKTADCVVGGYRLSKAGDGVGSLLLGLYTDDGVLHYVGHTSSFKAAERRELLKELQPLRGDGFGAGRTPGGPSRWTGARDMSWVSLEPRLVCEVKFDKLQGDRFRHAATFVRWRTDRDPRSCTFDQL